MSKYPMQALTGVTPADLSWLDGTWKSQTEKTVIEEHWSTVGGGDLMGMFRWQKDGAVWFYEILVMEADNNQVFHRLKHFYPGMKGWEEKDESVQFALVQLQGKEAVFLQLNRPDTTWLIYRLEEESKLVVYFEEEDASPKDEDKFVLLKS